MASSHRQAAAAAPRSPSGRKENMEEAPVDKRRRMVAPKAVGNNASRIRPVLSALNASSNAAPPVEVPIQFNSREDVETLLAERIKGKNKNDFKGKSEQMSEYIKKLRACIKWLMEVEDGLRAEEEKLRDTIAADGRKYAELEIQLNAVIQELKSKNQELKRQCVALEESLRNMEALKLDAIQCFEKEVELKVAAEKSRARVESELLKVTQEANKITIELKLLQDTNKRLQEYNTSLQQYNSSLQAEAAKSGEAAAKLQTEKSAMMDAMSSLRDHNNQLKNKLESSKTSQQEAVKIKDELKNEVDCLRIELQQVREERDNALTQVQEMYGDIIKFKELTGKSSQDMDNMFTKIGVLEDTCESQRNQIQTLHRQLAATNEKLKMADLTALETTSSYEEQKKWIKELEDRLANAETQISEGEKLRKKLHNTILELKGNIRVFCRVRPSQDSDGICLEGPVISYPSATETSGRGIDLTNQAQKYCFTFDKVFNHEASQEDIFVEISQLVQSALDGYKVCIFAYGQTGSGKTYTMIGKPELDEQKGLIPRSLEQIFQSSQCLKSQGWEYKLQASMLEIYNETIRDLLVPGGRSACLEPPGGASKQYSIKHDQNGNTVVTDLTVVDVYGIDDISFMLQQASQSRSVGRTQMNEQSSRSHFVFSLKISGTNKSTQQQVQSVVNLIDLAGSERLNKSGSTGDRLKETQAINKSLSALSDVFNAIAKKQDHVPFRNSKLTYLLQPCLGGDSKTLMFVNISPEPSSAGESLSSLRFAAGVNSCEIGVPRRQMQHLAPIDSRASCG